MKICIIGGVAGGATTATRLRRLDENAQIIIFEKGSFVSFANCGLPYYIGDVIKHKQDLLLQSPESFKSRFNIDVRIKSEVIKIDRNEKKIVVKNLLTDTEYEETYDKLVLSPGANPLNHFTGIKDDKIFTLRNVDDSVRIKEYIQNNKVENVCIIGGGYIGVEIAENLVKYDNLKVTIVEKSNHLISPLDTDMAGFVHNTILKHNINLCLNNGVKNIKYTDKFNIELENGEINSDIIILCVGVRPETNLAKEAGLELNKKGSIVVNEHMLTSDENIYALGDAVQVINYVTKKFAYIPLAGPANRQARVVANNICGKEEIYEGSIGSSILKVFEYTLAMTGINEETCKMYNIPYKKMVITPYSHATYYPNATFLTIKAIYDPKTGKILGSQVWGKEGVDKIADIMATSIRMDLTAHDLSILELCYAPPFSSAKSPVNILGNAIENEMDGLVKNIYVEDLKEKILNKENPYILDVRTDEEYLRGHLHEAIHIPLDNLRENFEKLENLDKSKEIYVHCFTGLRSYIACMILKQNGYNVRNIVGGKYFMKANVIKFEK